MSTQLEELFGKATGFISGTWKKKVKEFSLAKFVFGGWEKNAKEFHEAGEAWAGIGTAANPGNQASYARGLYLDAGFRVVGRVAGVGAKAAGVGFIAGAGLAAVPLIIAGKIVSGVGKRVAPSAFRTGVRGLLGAPGAAVNLGGAMIGAASKTLGGAELVARTVLTGTPTFRVNTKLGGYSKFGWQTESALDAWLPNFRNMSGDKLAKYALNPRIATRVAIGAFGVGLASAAWNVMNPKAPPASAYFDGVHMRRIGDMGATAGYGNRVMNSAPNFSNLDYRTASQSLVHLL